MLRGLVLVDSNREGLEASSHAHLDHRREYSLEPYAVHLQAVADLVASVTALTLSDLEHEFGYSVAQLVGELTDVSKPSDGNRAFRKSLDCAHLDKASPRESFLITLAYAL